MEQEKNLKHLTFGNGGSIKVNQDGSVLNDFRKQESIIGTRIDPLWISFFNGFRSLKPANQLYINTCT